MFIRSLASIFIVVSSFVFVAGQTPDADKRAKAASPVLHERLRDIPFPAGVDLQYLIMELARELDLNVLFDPESFRTRRKTFIELKNVTAWTAIEYILLQEQLIYEQVGPRTILISRRGTGEGISQIGVGTNYLPDQLAQYFGVKSGILINRVVPGSPAEKAGLKAGDVIVEMDGVRVIGPIHVINAINAKKGADFSLKIVRDRKARTVTLTPNMGIK